MSAQGLEDHVRAIFTAQIRLVVLLVAVCMGMKLLEKNALILTSVKIGEYAQKTLIVEIQLEALLVSVTPV